MHIFSDYPLLPSLMTALGIGLMIGMVRERTHMETFAGIRTHALTAVAAVLGANLGAGPLLVVLSLVALLVAMAYWRTATKDAGLTGEIALMMTALLGSLSVNETGLAAGLAALTAGLLYAKGPIHRFTKEILSEREVHDGLILLASALIILPLLPDRPIDAYGVLNPAKLWRLVVLVMLVGAIAHVALRLVGNRWGLPLAGAFSGYVSSTAATLNYAGTARVDPEMRSPALAAALLANATSLSLFIPILLAVAPDLLHSIGMELAAAILAFIALSVFGLHHSKQTTKPSSVAQKRMFRLQHAFALVTIIASVLFLTAALNKLLGPSWAVALIMVTAGVELHAAVIGLGELYNNGVLPQVHWAFFGLLLASSVVKTAIAWIAGGRDFGLRFGAAMIIALATVAIVAWMGI